jgi:hypothetical protein
MAALKVKPGYLTVRQHKAALAEAVRLEGLKYAPLVFAATAAKDTLDSLRRGASFSKAMYETGYQRLSGSLVGVTVGGKDSP